MLDIYLDMIFDKLLDTRIKKMTPDNSLPEAIFLAMVATSAFENARVARTKIAHFLWTF